MFKILRQYGNGNLFDIIYNIFGVPCLETNLKSEDLLQSDETFLTNTRYEILPVSFANGLQIGSGKPGPLTGRLRRKFLKIVEEETLSC